MNKWISVKDDLPVKDGNYICINEKGSMNIEHYMAHWWIGYTHWIELPELPVFNERSKER